MPSKPTNVPRHFVAIVLAAAALAAACSGSAAVEGDSEAAGEVPALSRGEFTRELLLTGELESVRSISIKAPQTSIFQMRIQFMAEEGSEVRKGDPLLDFDNSALANQVQDLETRILDAETQIVARRSELASALKDLEIELAEREYEYGRAKLEAEVDPEVLSRKDYSERQLAFTKAESELQETNDRVELTKARGKADLDVLVINRDKLKQDLLLAQDELGRLSIEAPADGLVVYEKRDRSTLRYQEGDSCWPGQGVIKLPDLSEMRIVFDVNEVDAPKLTPGAEIDITLDAFPGRRLRGRLVHIPSMAVKRDEQSKIAVFKVQAELEETWVGEMKPGMSARGRIVLDTKQDVPRVARRAVRFDGETYWFRTPGKGDEGGRETRIEPLERNAKYYTVSEQSYADLGGSAAVDTAEVRGAGSGT